VVRLKVVSLTEQSISVLDKESLRLIDEGISQVLVFDKDYNIVDPKISISSPIYNWDMLPSFAKLLVNATSQKRLVVIDTSNSVLSVQQDIIFDLFGFINSNYASMVKDSFSRLWVYAGPSLSIVDINTGKLVLNKDYGQEKLLPESTVSMIKETVDRVFTDADQPDSNHLSAFRNFIVQNNKKNMKLPFKTKDNRQFWDIPLDINGLQEYPFSLHLRTDLVENKILQITLKQLDDKGKGDNFANQVMPNGLRAWLMLKLNALLGADLQIVEGGKTSINFNAHGFDTKLNAISDFYARLKIDPKNKEIIYIGDEAKILPDNHPGNDAIVFSLPNISLINTGTLYDGSRSLQSVKLSDFGLSKGTGTKLFNMNMSHELKQTSSLKVTLGIIKEWFL